jgi:hypothetical protein
MMNMFWEIHHQIPSTVENNPGKRRTKCKTQIPSLPLPPRGDPVHYNPIELEHIHLNPIVHVSMGFISYIPHIDLGEISEKLTKFYIFSVGRHCTSPFTTQAEAVVDAGSGLALCQL